MLSSIEGSAVTSVKFAGAQHEFTSIPGVLEDIPEIILNIKSLILKKLKLPVLKSSILEWLYMNQLLK